MHRLVLQCVYLEGGSVLLLRYLRVRGSAYDSVVVFGRGIA